MSADELMVISMLGCTSEEATEYLLKSGGNILNAIADNVKCVQVSGEKYTPPPPKFDDGLTDDVRSKLQEARNISEMFSASFRNDLRGVLTQKPDEAAVVELTVPEVPVAPVDAASEIHLDA